jgi:uncharacterized protein (TIGR00255 family)
MPNRTASMTGFAESRKEGEWGTLIWELRSVNHRYLEIHLRLPESLRPVEMRFRELIQTAIARGKIEANLRFIPGSEVPCDFILNEPLLEQLAQAFQVVQSYMPHASHVNTLDVLKFPGVMEIVQSPLKDLPKAATELLHLALLELKTVRAREGEAISEFLQIGLQKAQEFVKVVAKRLPLWREQVKAKWQQRFNELAMELNRERLEQELVWLLQKSDVAEELQRLEAHLLEVARVLDNLGSKGRRLDFLMQELHREANTLGSKSQDTEITQAVLELKVLIEQMREQVQNIE